MRFSTYAAIVAAASLPVAISEVTRLTAGRSHGLQAASRVTLLAVVMLANRAGVLRLLYDAPASPLVSVAEECPAASLGPMLAPYAGQVVLTDVNLVPELLYRTDILTVGSLYTRNIDAFMRLRAAWRSGPSDGVPAEIRAAKISAVMVCPRSTRSLLVSDLPPETLLDRLGRGEAPPWLKRADSDKRSGNVLYQVIE